MEFSIGYLDNKGSEISGVGFKATNRDKAIKMAMKDMPSGTKKIQIGIVKKGTGKMIGTYNIAKDIYENENMELIDKYIGEKSIVDKERINEAKNTSTPMECMECGKKFKKKITKNTVEVKCPKCGGYDTDIA